MSTVNDYNKLPRSLCRAGRFDRQIEFEAPCREDAYQIIQHYLNGKKIDETVNLDDLSRMIDYESCANLETIINEAAIYAANKRKAAIGMTDLVQAILRKEYDAPESFRKLSDKRIRKAALHEAGHAVVSETIIPGSVGMISVRTAEGHQGGLMHPCITSFTPAQSALISPGGKTAVEMYYPEKAAEGCSDDIDKAIRMIHLRLGKEAALGFSLIDIGLAEYEDSSPFLLNRREIAIQTELERYQFQVRGILTKNKMFLEKTMEELIQKETLLYSDVQRIRVSCDV